MACGENRIPPYGYPLVPMPCVGTIVETLRVAQPGTQHSRRRRVQQEYATRSVMASVPTPERGNERE